MEQARSIKLGGSSLVRDRVDEPPYQDIGILQTLRDEHRELQHLLDQCLFATHEEQVGAYVPLRRKLLLHSKCEETEFYALCESERRLEPLMRESEQDHQLIERLVSRLDHYEPVQAFWRQAFIQLYNALGVHIVFEESQVFPIAREFFGGRRLIEMDDAYRSLREIAAHRALSHDVTGSPLRP